MNSVARQVQSLEFIARRESHSRCLLRREMQSYYNHSKQLERATLHLSFLGNRWNEAASLLDVVFV